MAPQNGYQFAIDPTEFNLPTRQDLIDHRVWSTHYHGIGNHDAVMQYMNRMGIERLISLDIAGSWDNDKEDDLPPPPSEASERIQKQLKILEESNGRILGIIRIDPSRPELSIQHINNYIENGPCIGIKYLTEPQGYTCAHPNNDAIVQRAHELDALIYVHTYLKKGGDPPYYGGGNYVGESTPSDLAELASRNPEVPMICGHTGSVWELATRAIRPHENVYLEYSGSPSWSGMVDYGANWLGVDRLVWGDHGPSRCLATEMSKVFDGDLTFEERKKVFGGNVRRLLSNILERKGLDQRVEVPSEPTS